MTSQASLFELHTHFIDDAEIQRTASISPCGLYRYRLGRRWSEGRQMLFVMLNPSTADASLDDATIRRCIGFARREGCGAIEVVNLFAFRATNPAAIATAGDPIGPDNDSTIEAAARAGGIVVAAWGASVPRAHASRPAKVLRMLQGHGPISTLGLTRAGAPRNPLYLPAASPLAIFGGSPS